MNRPADQIPRRDPGVQRAIELLQDADDRLRNGSRRAAWNRLAEALEQVQSLMRAFPYEGAPSWTRTAPPSTAATPEGK